MPVEANVRLGDGVRIHRPEPVNLYGCTIGDGSTVGPFVEIQKGAVVTRDVPDHALAVGVPARAIGDAPG